MFVRTSQLNRSLCLTILLSLVVAWSTLFNTRNTSAQASLRIPRAEMERQIKALAAPLVSQDNHLYWRDPDNPVSVTRLDQQVDVRNGHTLLWNGSADRAVDLNPSGSGSSFGIGTSGGQQSGSGVEAPNCVRDIENVFREGVFGYRSTTSGGVEEGPTGRFRIHLHGGEPLPPEGQRVTGLTGFGSHVQSIVRVPGSGGSYNWMVMARKKRSLGAPFYVFEIGSLGKTYDGERFVKFNREDRNYYDRYLYNAENRTRAYLEIPSTEHIGGMQAIGNIVAMPVTCDSSRDCKASVMFWDFSSPLQPRLVHELKLEPPGAAHWVAVTSLRSGRLRGHLLLIVNRGDDGTTDTYITKHSRPLDSSTSWYRLPQLEINTGVYQNANFLWGCETEGLYLLGMRQIGSDWQGDNRVGLYRVDGLAPLRLTYISGATFERYGNYCEMRGGSSVYVEPDGSPIVYCAAGQSEDNALKVSEITADGWR